MRLRVRYSPLAQADLLAISDYLKERSPIAADNVLRDIFASIQLVADLPSASERTNLGNLRVKIARRYRYKIYYVVNDEAVEIVHVRHSARRPLLE